MKENIDYELIPHDNDMWAIRMLKGDYVETEYQYNVIRVREDDMLSYSVDILKSPMSDLTDKDSDFQVMTGHVLLDILENNTGK